MFTPELNMHAHAWQDDWGLELILTFAPILSDKELEAEKKNNQYVIYRCFLYEMQPVKYILCSELTFIQ